MLRECKGIQITPAAKLRVWPEQMGLLEQTKIIILQVNYLSTLDMAAKNLGSADLCCHDSPEELAFLRDCDSVWGGNWRGSQQGILPFVQQYYMPCAIPPNMYKPHSIHKATTAKWNKTFWFQHLHSFHFTEVFKHTYI